MKVLVPSLLLALTLTACSGSAPGGLTGPDGYPVGFSRDALTGTLTNEQLGGGYSAAELEVLTRLNAARAKGVTCSRTGESVVMPPVPALRMEGHLHLAARRHSADMKARAYFDHVAPAPAPHGAEHDERIATAGLPDTTTTGENLAAGQDSAAEVTEAWLGSFGHCRNMMDANFRFVGIAINKGAITGSATSEMDNLWTMKLAGAPLR